MLVCHNKTIRYHPIHCLANCHPKRNKYRIHCVYFYAFVPRRLICHISTSYAPDEVPATTKTTTSTTTKRWKSHATSNIIHSLSHTTIRTHSHSHTHTCPHIHSRISRANRSSLFVDESWKGGIGRALKILARFTYW